MYEKYTYNIYIYIIFFSAILDVFGGAVTFNVFTRVHHTQYVKIRYL